MYTLSFPILTSTFLPSGLRVSVNQKQYYSRADFEFFILHCL